MGAASGAGDFREHVDACVVARTRVCGGVCFPVAVVEVADEELAAVPEEHGVDAGVEWGLLEGADKLIEACFVPRPVIVSCSRNRCSTSATPSSSQPPKNLLHFGSVR